MKRILLFAALVLMAVSTVQATTMCNDASVLGHSVTTIGSCELGGLTFSNFYVGPGQGFTPDHPIVTLDNAYVLGGRVDLAFVTNADFYAGNRDIPLRFTINGGAQQYLSGFLGTPYGNVKMTESVCSEWDTGFNCTTPGSIGSFVVTTADPYKIFNLGQTYNNIMVKKDIAIGEGATLSQFTEDFGKVPEPATAGLIGGGLLALGMLRRRLGF